MITAVLEGELEKVEYRTHEIFGIEIPQSCPDVPNEILNPKDTWENKEDYDKTAKKVAQQFVSNFEKYKDYATESISSGAPKI